MHTRTRIYSHAHAHARSLTHARAGPRTAESKFASPDAGSFGCKYTFAEPLALLCTLYRDEKTGVCQAKEGKITVTLRIAKGTCGARVCVDWTWTWNWRMGEVGKLVIE